jgi:hypothetical protein
VQALPSEHGVPPRLGGTGALTGRRIANAGFVTPHRSGAFDRGAGDALAAAVALIAVHTPLPVQALPSEHGVPLGLAAAEH